MTIAPAGRPRGEHEVRSPLMEAGLNKGDIRELSRRAELPTADQPASACLASRFPYGVQITEEKLRMVDQGEEALREIGISASSGCVIMKKWFDSNLALQQFGLRALNPESAAHLTRLFKGIGYKYVTLDLEGYRMGSLNEVLVTEIK